MKQFHTIYWNILIYRNYDPKPTMKKSLEIAGVFFPGPQQNCQQDQNDSGIAMEDIDTSGQDIVVEIEDM